VLPAALDLGIRIDASPAEQIALGSREREGLARAAPDGRPAGESPRGWARYVAAVATELSLLGRPGVGLEGELTSTLPIGTGLSSSAALEVAVATALCAVADFPLEPMELAQAARRAEFRAVGVPCGVMDQATSTLARAEHLLLLDTGSLEYEHVRFPDELALVIVDSGVPRRLEHSGYADRRRELLEAIVALGGRDPGSLTVAEVDRLGLPAVPARRLRHVVSENGRVRETAALLRDPAGADLDRLSALFREAHESLRTDLEVTIPELDLLVELAYASGARAARMTGGGFGGSIVAVVEMAVSGPFAEALTTAYRSESGRETSAIVSRPAGSAREFL
jgi:galactokinase